MATIRAFVLGMAEFRCDLTTSFVGSPSEESLSCAYDLGRDLAHRLTFRHWDNS